MMVIVNGVPSDKQAADEAWIAEHHIHVRERWLSKLASPAGGHTAEQGMSPFVVASGDNTWGAYVQLLDINDTPTIPGYKYYDFRRLMLVDASVTSPYRVRFLYGSTTPEDALAALSYTDFVYEADATNKYSRPVEVSMVRLPVGTKLWASCWNATNGATIDFFIGGHLYLQ